MPLVGNMPVQPGTILVKIQSDPTVYWVEEMPGDPYNPVLRPIDSEATAEALAGSDWNLRILDIRDVFFVDYTVDPTDPVTLANVQEIDTSNLLTLADLQE